MKKILGILGITLIIAVSFFNISSVVDTNQNVDLASIIQKASANGEDDASYVLDKVETSFKNTHTYTNDDGKICKDIEEGFVITCEGTGPISCTPEIKVTKTTNDCDS